MQIYEPRMNKEFTLGSAHEDEVTPRQVATSSPSGETIMTKPIGSFGAIVAIFTLPLAAYAQPIGGTAAPGAPPRPATGVVTSAPKGAGGAGHAASRSSLGRPEHENSPVRYEGEKAVRKRDGEIGCRQYPANQCRALSPAGGCRRL